ncbi:DUF5000 domain-containing lipoprotein [Terrimonas rubra]|uniref:DUF5000 domain-containing lipoprotein n=1 Tax=Terrimonas rubra TaxID=1035890 RepID=A0ABW6A6D7_9BACT
MFKNIATFLTLAIFLLMGAGCKRELHSSLYDDGSTPSPITNTTVQNLPGAAEITYSLPHDNNILYVKAEYEIRPGVKREVKSSYYNNSLLVDGFGNTNEYSIKLYVVTRSEIQSAPVTVTVKPLVPPVVATFNSLTVAEDFGGLIINYLNDAKADLAIHTLAADSTGAMVEANTNYTTLPSGRYTIRGFDSTSRKFSFFVKDRFGNISDTLTATYKPLYEKLLDKSLFRTVLLPTDVKDDWGLPMQNMWNNGYTDFWDMFHTQTQSFPMWFTFDLGITVKLSRMALWQRQSPAADWAYNANNPKKFEVWGSTSPDVDGGWNNWIKLTDHEVVKPSGLPLGQVSADDIAAAAKGEEIPIPLSMPQVRYIRFRILETFTNSATNIAEISVWGQP